MANRVRTRFAPSPTGHLHIGGARTALFSWLFARHHQGEFILRMEDTDQARSTQESVDQVLRDLKWLGLDWDEGPGMDGKSSQGPEGPYFQSQRLTIYDKYLSDLKLEGLAYPSFDSKEEVEAEREAAIASGQAPASAGHEASPEEVAAKAKEGIKPAWRFRMPSDGQTEFQDLVHGAMRFENRLMADFVIVRSDGMPTFKFAGVVDDALMGITHVVRGDDHLSNTPHQVCLYQALEMPLPLFAHIPMILGADRQRLSKRHGATAVGQYRDMGILPEALVNYLALLGWSFDDKQTLFSIPELVEKFSIERVGKNAAVFDLPKLEWINGQYLKTATLDRVAELAWPFFVAKGLVHESESPSKWEWFKTLVASVKEKCRTLATLPEETEFFFKDFAAPEAEALTKFFAKGDPKAWLKQYAEEMAAQAEFTLASLEAFTRAFADKAGMKFGDLVGPLRAALTGRTVSPGLFETMALLGKDKSLARVKKSLEWRP